MDNQSSILVVDDFPTMRLIIRNFLRELGYVNIAEAGDGAEALEAIQTGRFDLVITDWKMPVLAGLQLLEAIRNHPTYSELPVIMVAAEARQEQINAAAEAGVSGYIVKPFTAEILAVKIKTIEDSQLSAA